MRVLYFGTYDRAFGRNRIMADGLTANGIEVVECHVPLWRNTDDKLAKASGRWLRLSFVFRVLCAYLALLRAYWPLRASYDVMVLGYAGQFDAFIARPLTWLARRPLVLDLCMSLYLIVTQRGLAHTHKITSRVIRGCEWLACRLPDLLILDTPEYVRYFCDTYGISAERFRLVPAGADDQIFRPMPPRAEDGKFRVVFHGTFIPHGHGIEVILRAADLLRNHPEISFELIGDGQAKADAVELARSLALPNVEFTGWVLKAQLPARLAQADVILGVFGTTAHVFLTIPNKIFEGLAMRKPVITRDSPAVRRTLQHLEDIYLIGSDEPAALAHAILDLQAHPQLRKELGDNGYAKVTEQYTLTGLGCLFAQHLRELLARRRPREKALFEGMA
jgi:glycosyltransferase involved in cell wall biosynthesis